MTLRRSTRIKARNASEASHQRAQLDTNNSTTNKNNKKPKQQ